MKKVLAIILVALVGAVSTASAQSREQTGKPKLNIAILIFKGAEVIDYAGPIEVFAQFSQSRLPHNIYTVAEKAEPVTTSALTIKPDYSFANHPRPDVLVLPGGSGFNGLDEANNANTIKWIRENAKQAQYVLSVCNGAFLLAQAGLLDGLEATTFAGMIESLRKAAPNTKVVTDKRFVDNGKIITSAGLSSGIEGALHIIERIHGKGWAQAVALNMEYNWQPESGYARADLADMKLPGSIYEPFYREGEPVSAEGGRDRWEEKWIVQTEASSATMLERINGKWATEARWTRLEAKNGTGATESAWKFTDERGTTWNGMISVQPVAGERNKLVVTLAITREGAKA